MRSRCGERRDEARAEFQRGLELELPAELRASLSPRW
jgi:hypothetical protein